MKSGYWVPGIFILFIAAVFTFTGQVFAYSSSSPMVLVCSVDNPPGDMKAKTVKRIGDLVSKRTDGRIKFKYFWGSSLIKKPQFVDAVAMGIADISTGPVSFITGKIPELSIFEIYGSYRLDKYVEIQHAVWGPMVKLFEPKGIHPLMFQYSGTALFPHRSKLLNTPADWKGQKMRLAGRWQASMGKKWGAVSIFMPPGDVYLAVQRGVIDGYMLIWDIVAGLKLYEVSPYILDTGFSGNIEVVTMNLKKWKKLTNKDRAIFQQVLDEVTEWTYTETIKHYDNVRKKIASKGITIHTLTAEEKTLYLKEVKKLYPEVRKVSGKIGNQFIDILEANNFSDK